VSKHHHLELPGRLAERAAAVEATSLGAPRRVGGRADNLVEEELPRVLLQLPANAAVVQPVVVIVVYAVDRHAAQRRLARLRVRLTQLRGRCHRPFRVHGIAQPQPQRRRLRSDGVPHRLRLELLPAGAERHAQWCADVQ